MPFYVKTLNSQGEEILVEVSFEVYTIFEQEGKEIERLRKENDRHGDDSEVESDVVLYKYSLKTASVEDQVDYRREIEAVMQVVKICTKIQQRRFHLNRILGYSFTEIASMENCSEGAVRKSVRSVSEKVKNYFQE